MIKKVKIENLDEVLSRMEAKKITLTKACIPALKKAAKPIYEEAKVGAVNIRRTGTTARELKTSNVYLEGGNIAIDIGFEKGTKAWYAHFPEFGTSHSAAKPFMRPAFDRKRGKAKDAFIGEIKKAVEVP